MSLDSVIEKYDEYLYPDMDLSELVKSISASRRDVFPVVDRQHRLVGIIYLDNVRPIMFRQELYHRFQIGQLMSEPVARLNINDSMDVVLLTFDRTGGLDASRGGHRGHVHGIYPQVARADTLPQDDGRPVRRLNQKGE